MIKSKIVESIRGYLMANEPDQDSVGKINYKRIETACDEVFDTLINAILKDTKGVDANLVKDYRNQVVKRSNGVCYLDINDAYVNLPEGQGVWYVKPNGSQYPLPRSGRHVAGLLASLPIGEIVNNSVYRVGYIGNDKKIIIEHLGQSIYAVTTRWDYGLIRQFSAYADTEDVPISKYDVFINQVLQWFGKRPMDNVNNNQ